jgi:hypothetical protein
VRAATLADWWPTELRIIAHLSISRSDVEVLCDGARLELVDSQQDEIAVFRLDSGIVVALARVIQNSVAGFTLMAQGEIDIDRVLSDFLREGNIDIKLVSMPPDWPYSSASDSR